MLEVYVDDFCAMAQSTNAAELRHVSRALLHSVHDVFPPPEISDINLRVILASLYLEAASFDISKVTTMVGIIEGEHFE